MKNKYPAKLFWSGVVVNMLRKFVLLIAAIVLLIIGIWNTTCLYIGAVLLLLSIASAIFEQLVYKRSVTEDSDPDFADIRAKILDENWDENMKEIIEKSIEESLEREKQYLALTREELKELSDDELLFAAVARCEHKVDSARTVKDGFNTLNGSERVLYALNYLEMEVNNGGLCQFFVNSSRAVAPFVSEYMGIVGAKEHKKLFDGFIRDNGIDLTSLDSFDVEDADEFEEQNERYPFDDYDDKFYELEPIEGYLKSFVRQNISDF